MNILEKRDFIHSNLQFADEKTIDEFYEKLRKDEVLRAKLESRADKAENDIHTGRIFSRTDIEQRTATIGR
ncbi:MAG: hypothetical protein K0B37_03700 [Bacteroidales bacterium]|nr:hypothetical protein [Bacteroidales bacterium]